MLRKYAPMTCSRRCSISSSNRRCASVSANRYSRSSWMLARRVRRQRVEEGLTHPRVLFRAERERRALALEDLLQPLAHLLQGPRGFSASCSRSRPPSGGNGRVQAENRPRIPRWSRRSIASRASIPDRRSSETSSSRSAAGRSGPKGSCESSQREYRIAWRTSVRRVERNGERQSSRSVRGTRRAAQDRSEGLGRPPGGARIQRARTRADLRGHVRQTRHAYPTDRPRRPRRRPREQSTGRTSVNVEASSRRPCRRRAPRRTSRKPVTSTPPIRSPCPSARRSPPGPRSRPRTRRSCRAPRSPRPGRRAGPTRTTTDRACRGPNGEGGGPPPPAPAAPCDGTTARRVPTPMPRPVIRARDVSPKQMNETHAKGTHGLAGRSMPIDLAFPARDDVREDEQQDRRPARTRSGERRRGSRASPSAGPSAAARSRGAPVPRPRPARP